MKTILMEIMKMMTRFDEDVGGCHCDDDGGGGGDGC